MILAMAQDIRVVIIKLADRLDNMKTLWVLPKEKQLRIARETLDIYASIAYRLGIGVVGAQLEDFGFSLCFSEGVSFSTTTDRQEIQRERSFFN